MAQSGRKNSRSGGRPNGKPNGRSSSRSGGRPRRRRRRGGGGLGPLMRLLSVVLTAVAIVVALTLFFKVEQVLVSGNSRYTQEEIAAVSGVTRGDNLILLDKYQIAKKLYTELPFITDVRVNRKLPDSLVIEVTETSVSLALESGGAWWLLSESGKVLDVTDGGSAEGCLLLRGITAEGIAVGEQLRLAEDGNLSTERLLELIQELSERGMLEYTDSVDATDDEVLHIGYDGRFDVELYYDADFPFKLECLRAAVNELEPNETGILRMTMENEIEVRLIPFAP